MNELERSAIHEAGHAIAACDLECLYLGASIMPNIDAGTLGHVRVADDEPAEHHAVVDYAGHAALVIVGGVGEMTEESAMAHGAGQDFDEARERCGADPAAMDRARARALQIITIRQHDVRKIAAELLKRKRLSGQQIDWLLYRPEPIPEWLE